MTVGLIKVKGLVVVGIALLMIVVMHGEKMMIEEVMMVAGVLAKVVVVKVVSVAGDNSNMMVEVLEVTGGWYSTKFRLRVCRPQTLAVFKDETKAGWMICMKFSSRG